MPTSGPDPLAEPLAAVDALIAAVRSVPSIGGGRGDRAGLILHGAYSKAFRRLVSIRDLAGRGAGEDALILVRSLLSIVARAVWVNQPSKLEERRARFLMYRRGDLEDGLRMLAEGARAGIEADTGVHDSMAEELAELKSQGVAKLPTDRQILEAVNMQPYYAQIYMRASEHVHFSLTAAIRHLLNVEQAPLEAPQWDAAVDAAWFGFIVFAFFLETSEKLIGHGLSGKVQAIAREHFGA